MASLFSRAIFVLLWLWLPVIVYAHPDAICDDLLKYTCMPGEFNDGTGTGKIVTKEDRITAIKRLAWKNAEKVIKGGNEQFKKLFLDMSGRQNEPSCQNSNAKNLSSECVTQLTSDLYKVFSRSLLGPEDSEAYAKQYAFPDLWNLVHSPVYTDSLNSMNEEIKRMVDEEETHRIVETKVFPSVKELVKSTIESMDIDSRAKEEMLTKLERIKFGGTNCHKTGNVAAQFLDDNAFYFHATEEFTYCAGSRYQNSSEFEMAFVIAHELAHSIDPCSITLHGNKDFKHTSKVDVDKSGFGYPFKSLMSCLRDSSSVNARIKSPVFQTPKSYCPNANGETNDQITEAFADRIATEVLPGYIDEHYSHLTEKQKRIGYSNVWKKGCNVRRKGFEGHPPIDRRVNFNLLVHPDIREQMGCPPQTPGKKFCDIPKIKGQQRNRPATSKAKGKPTK